ncbi:DUF1801 domain-containing protein [Pleionea litopenaei]|uniref:DUF1801 domain-containing protein n=1 Tax=Pleionea litopenaei TaxID=3070815 RepID=A0AA51RVL4_9GAMM|nr:DUF1801 domain-containing protein [Pleionea sp. HL-JVS1]WMS88273.1 DUF1801 domain-containing protein [Pleionea sp. HL-JVS1]
MMNQLVERRFNSYPESIFPLINRLRVLIFSVAGELDLGPVNESLKWGEPSYSVKDGSPIRIDWKEKTPNQHYLFFHCQTKLVDTFRELYGDILECSGNRAIVLNVEHKLPEQAVRHCIQLALQYKRIKHLPMLGV